MKAKTVVFIPLLLLGNFVTSCSGSTPVNDNDVSLTKKTYSLVNYSDEYSLEKDSMTVYFYEDGHVPLVSLLHFIQSLDGFLDLDDMYYRTDEYENYQIHFWNFGNYTYSLTAHWDTDKIYVNGMSYFSKTPIHRTNRV